MQEDPLVKTVKQNCDISDARDNGIYSICTLVLKLRNLYKWEHDLEPWQEPDSPVLLDWIGAKEEYWETIRHRQFLHVPVNGVEVDPFLLPEINKYLSSENHAYGAGFGRSLKAVFFIAEILEKREVEDCPTLILGKEKARELSSPFAMLQDGVIYIRKEPLRFFFWDQIQEINSSCKMAVQQALASYGLPVNGCSVDRHKLVDIFDSIVDRELEMFIYHEVGERQETMLDSSMLQKIIAAFPDSAIELVARAVKDILADTHPKGLLSHILAHEKKSTLGFYISFLDGMRKHLCSELNEAGKKFWESGDWQLIERALQQCRAKNETIAARLGDMCARLERGYAVEEVKTWGKRNVLEPLGLNVPAKDPETT